MDFNQINVLVVEDNLVAGKVLQRFLEELHCDFHMAETASEALELLKNYAFDIALIDLNLPESSGQELASKITKSHPELHMVAMTAFVESESREDCLRLGFDELIIKPLSVEQIKKTITESLDTNQTKTYSQEEVDAVMKYFNHDTTFIMQTFKLLLDNFDQKIAELETATKAKDYELLSRKAHSLKNSLIYFGPSMALDNITNIELSARKKEAKEYLYDIHNIKSQIEKLEEKIHSICNFVEANNRKGA